MNNTTEILFILDMSGSMYQLKDDTIGGYNAMLEDHRGSENDVYVSTVVFNQCSKVIVDRKKISEVKNMTNEDYCPKGSTALLDAVGNAVKHISNVQKYIREEDVPAKTLVVITTDGMENASREYTYHSLRKLIERKKEEGWEFLFLGANIDAEEEAEKIGIRKERAAKYCADKQGTALNFMCVSKAMDSFMDCECGQIPDDWAEEIVEYEQSK